MNYTKDTKALFVSFVYFVVPSSIVSYSEIPSHLETFWRLLPLTGRVNHRRYFKGV